MGSRWRRTIALLLILCALGLGSCGDDRPTPVVLLEGTEVNPTVNPIVGAIAEVSPPERIQQLKPYLDVYQPQVRIVSPRENETLQSTQVSVDLQIRDMPLFRDAALGLGPHLHLFLDDQPYQEVYDTREPIVLSDLTPGTHTLRVFATRPWGESFKNEGAYDQVSFNVFTASANNLPDSSQALLTFNEPQGQYGAEPILLDFYLKNAPLHVVAEDLATVPNWRIRCTVNGESFVFDRWQPLYLKGFQPGQNWVKLELIDEVGNPIDNAYNTAIRVIDYRPDSTDAFAKLIRGDIPLASAKGLVDPNYIPPVIPESPALPTAEPIVPAPAPEEVAPKEPEKIIQPEPVAEPTQGTAPIVPLPSASEPMPDSSAPALKSSAANDAETGESFGIPVKLPQGLLPDAETEEPAVTENSAAPEAAIAPTLTDETLPAPRQGLRSRFSRALKRAPVAPTHPVVPTPEVLPSLPSVDPAPVEVPVPETLPAPSIQFPEPAPSVEEPSLLERLEEQIEQLELPDLPDLPEAIAPPPLPERIQERRNNALERSLPELTKPSINPTAEPSLEPSLPSASALELPNPQEPVQEVPPETSAPSSAEPTVGDRANGAPPQVIPETDPDTPLEILEEEAELI